MPYSSQTFVTQLENKGEKGYNYSIWISKIMMHVTNNV